MAWVTVCDLVVLEAAVAEAKKRYVKERDAHRPSTVQWNTYARLLHKLRLSKREMKDE